VNQQDIMKKSPATTVRKSPANTVRKSAAAAESPDDAVESLLEADWDSYLSISGTTGFVDSDAGVPEKSQIGLLGGVYICCNVATHDEFDDGVPAIVTVCDFNRPPPQEFSCGGSPPIDERNVALFTELANNFLAEALERLSHLGVEHERLTPFKFILSYGGIFCHISIIQDS